MSLINRLFKKEEYINKANVKPMFRDYTEFRAEFGKIFPKQIKPKSQSTKPLINAFVSQHAENEIFDELAEALYLKLKDCKIIE